MKNLKRVEGKLKIIDRLPSSNNGNPRYLVEVGDVVAATTPDSLLAYGITNYLGKEVIMEYGIHRNKISVNNVFLKGK